MKIGILGKLGYPPYTYLQIMSEHEIPPNHEMMDRLGPSNKYYLAAYLEPKLSRPVLIWQHEILEDPETGEYFYYRQR